MATLTTVDFAGVNGIDLASSTTGGVTTIGLDAESGLNIGDVVDDLGTQVGLKEQAIETLYSTGDFEDSATVLRMQQYMNEWSYYIGLQSSMIKTLADAFKSMTNKIQ